jgi:hypothetical protein
MILRKVLKQKYLSSSRARKEATSTRDSWGGQGGDWTASTAWFVPLHFKTPLAAEQFEGSEHGISSRV